MKTSYSSSDFDTVFCDSTEALSRAFDEGLSKYVKIKTSSPALLWRNDLNVEGNSDVKLDRQNLMLLWLNF